MNQTKKRLTIIELAISITDIETIKLQIRKLQALRSDADIDTILTELEAKNYAQAQHLIGEYIESADNTVIQRIPEEELEIIETYDFLEVKTSSVNTNTIDEEAEVEVDATEQEEITEKVEQAEETLLEKDISDDTLDIPTTKEIPTPSVASFDALLNIHEDKILSYNIQLDSATVENEVTLDIEKEKIDFALNAIPKDTFFDTIPSKKPEEINNTAEETIVPEEKIEIPEDKKIVIEDVFKTIKMDESAREALLHATEEAQEKPENTTRNNIYYTLQDLQSTYPPVETKEVYTEKFETWLETIEEDAYSNAEIEEILKHIEQLSQTDKAEAAQFLLATSMTKSDYAQFILARALYRGTLLERNLEESFRIMSQLAFKDHYPQALCDLAQFYENGIVTSRDKKQALELYKEAMDLGIERAQKHYERLSEETKGLFSFFK